MRLLRALHRWISIVVVVVFLLIAGSGVLLQFNLNRMDEIAPYRLTDAQIVEDFRLSLAAARRIKGDAQLGSTLLNVAGPQPLVVTRFHSPGAPPTEMQAVPGGGPEDLTQDLRTGAVVPSVGDFHRFLVRFHNSFYLGSFGRILDLLSGVGLFFLGISGLWMYIELLRQRVKHGRRAWFWSSRRASSSSDEGGGAVAPLASPVWYRDLHRWLNTPSAVFFLVISVTGIMLQLSAFGLIGGFPGGPPRTTTTREMPAALTDAQLVQALANSLAAAERVEPGGELFMILLNATGPSTRASLTYGSYAEGMYSRNFDARTAAYRPMRKPTGISNFFLLRLHRGDLFHTPGTVLDIVFGITLLLLSISGLVMYLDMLFRRQRGGRRRWFWY